MVNEVTLCVAKVWNLISNLIYLLLLHKQDSQIENKLVNLLYKISFKIL